MFFPKMFIIGTCGVFFTIGAVGYLKNRNQTNNAPIATQEIQTKVASEEKPLPKAPKKVSSSQLNIISEDIEDEDVDRISYLFTTSSKKLPIVETLTYTSRVPWLKGRPAWIADYASKYKTSRHFIARSLNRKADYYTQKVAPGDRFNVFCQDKNINFHLLVDLSRCKMWFYYVDVDTNERVLLKTYKVGLGYLDDHLPSGTITPEDKFLLGEKTATYKPKVMGYFQNERVEMIQIFGTRWLPFKGLDSEDISYGYGIHGAPCFFDDETGELKEMKECIGKYESDGCVRMFREDMEELFAIVVTKPTIVEITKDSKPIRQGWAD